MIRFSCPRCKAVLERPVHVAGTKFACPSCGQKLQVPQAPQPPAPENKTILGDLLETPVPLAGPGGSGRSSQSWYCPLCQNQVTATIDPGQTSIRCPSCSGKIQVPQQPAAAPIPLPMPPQPTPYVTPLAVSMPPPMPASAPPPPGPPPLPRSRRRDDYYDDDDDYDYPRRRRRYSEPASPERLDYVARSAFASFLCALIGLGLLLVAILVWALAIRHTAPLRREFDGTYVVLLMILLGSFILCLLGVVFASRGMDEVNTQNRGLAVGGLVCGIVGLVVNAIGLFFYFCVGLLFWSNFR